MVQPNTSEDITPSSTAVAIPSNVLMGDDGQPVIDSPTLDSFPTGELGNGQSLFSYVNSSVSEPTNSDCTPRFTNTLPMNEDLNIHQQVVLKEQRLEDIKNQCSELISELDSNQNPEAIVKKHISQLKKYNELKDIALGLVTMIADQRQLKTTDILEEMKVELGED